MKTNTIQQQKSTYAKVLLFVIMFCFISACNTYQPVGCATFDSKEQAKARTQNRGKALSTPKWNKASNTKKVSKRKAKKTQKGI